MWVQEIFIDEFDGGGDLALQQLRPTLNVVRVPSSAAAACLARFIPGLLYGPCLEAGPAEGGPTRSGSLLVAQPTPAGAWEVLDLCRIPLETANNLSELQILPDRRQTFDEGPLREKLEVVDDDVYRMVFTDELPLLDRLAAWRGADWIVPLLRRPPIANSAERAEIAAASAGQATPSEALHSAALREGVSRAATLSQQLNVGLAAAATADTDRPLGQDDLAAAREGYFRANQQAHTLRELIGELRERCQQQERSMAWLEQAAELQPTWQRLRSLEDQLAGPAPAPVAADDVERLRQIHRQAQAARRQWQQVGERTDDHRTRRAQLKRAASRQAELQRLLDDWSGCQECQRRADGLRTELANRASSPARSERAEMRRAIADVRSAARALQSARQDHAKANWSTDEADVSKRASAASVSEQDPRLENLRRQIRQLREESRRLLARQLLSRRALFSIGLMFSAGVAILLSALLLDLDGSNTSVGAIGLTCILAAALLKSSFERTPGHHLRRQRQRIAALFAELERLGRQADRPTDAADDATSPAASSVTNATPLAESPLAAAERAWQLTLQRWRLAPELTPADALRQLRGRLPRPSDPPEAPPPADQVKELRSREARVDRWCRRAGELLGQEAQAAGDQTPEQWHRQLQAAQQRLAEWMAAAAAETAAVADRAKLRRKWRALQRQGRAILEAYGASRVTELVQRLHQQQQRALARAEYEQLQRSFQASLPADPARPRISHWLDQSAADLEDERDRQRDALRLVQRQLDDAQQELVRQLAEMSRLAGRPQPPLVHSPATDAAAVAHQRRDRQAMALAGAVLAELARLEQPVSHETLASTSPARQTSLLLQWATDNFRQLSADEAVAIGWDDAAMGPHILAGDGSVTSVDDLDADRLAALVIALQLSLVRCLGQRIGHLPLVLTDRSFDAGARQLAPFARLLCDQAASGQQVLVVTTQTVVSEQFRRFDVPTLIVTRQAPATGASTSPAEAAGVR